MRPSGAITPKPVDRRKCDEPAKALSRRAGPLMGRRQSPNAQDLDRSLRTARLYGVCSLLGWTRAIFPQGNLIWHPISFFVAHKEAWEAEYGQDRLHAQGSYFKA
jgi:hypothetical protein